MVVVVAGYETQRGVDGRAGTTRAECVDELGERGGRILGGGERELEEVAKDDQLGGRSLPSRRLLRHWQSDERTGEGDERSTC